MRLLYLNWGQKSDHWVRTKKILYLCKGLLLRRSTELSRSHSGLVNSARLGINLVIWLAMPRKWRMSPTFYIGLGFCWMAFILSGSPTYCLTKAHRGPSLHIPLPIPYNYNQWIRKEFIWVNSFVISDVSLEANRFLRKICTFLYSCKQLNTFSRWLSCSQSLKLWFKTVRKKCLNKS